MALMVSAEETLIGAEYLVEPAVGVVPSVVSWMVAPVVASEMVTDCGNGTAPAAGLNVGLAAVGGGLMVSVSLALELGAKAAAPA